MDKEGAYIPASIMTTESEEKKSTSDSEETWVKAAQERMRELLEDMKNKCAPPDTVSKDQTDTLLNALSYQDFPDLWCAQAKLMVKSKDKLLDVFFQSQITGMVGTLNLYLDPQLSYTWCESSLLASKAAGHGMNHAQNLRMWILQFLNTGKLPLHCYGTFHSSILEDVTPEIQEQLSGKTKTTIHVCTACCWLNKLNWCYACKRNDMYVDGHGQKDVVKYQDEFIVRWREYEKRFIKYDNDGNPTN